MVASVRSTLLRMSGLFLLLASTIFLMPQLAFADSGSLSVSGSALTVQSNTLDTATSISTNKWYKESLYNPGEYSDEDWYKFTLTKKSKVSLQYSSDVMLSSDSSAYIDWDHHNLTLQVSLYSKTSWENWDAKDFYWEYGGVKKWKTYNLYLKPGTYYVSLKSCSYSNQWESDYSFKVNATNATLSEAEPDYTVNEYDNSRVWDVTGANPIAVNKSYAGTLYKPDSYSDDDYYTFTLKKAANVSLSYATDVLLSTDASAYIDWDHHNLRLQIMLTNAKSYASNETWDYNFDIPGDSKKWTSGKLRLPAGKYYVKLSSCHLSKQWGHDYKFQVISKLANGVSKVKSKSVTVKYSKISKKAVKVKASKAFRNLAKAQGKVTFAKIKKGSSKYLTINKSTGQVNLKKGTKKGLYRLKVKIRAAGDNSYYSGTKTVTVKVRVQ